MVSRSLGRLGPWLQSKLVYLMSGCLSTHYLRVRIRHTPTARVKCRSIGLTGAGRGGLPHATVGLAAVGLAVVLLTALGSAVAGLPAYAASGADATLTGSASGGPNQDLAMIFRWQKPSHTGTESCGGAVDFTFDSWPLASVAPTDQGVTCAASYFGPPPLLDRAPGKHTVRATPDAAGVPARAATYTIVVTPRSGASPTGRPSSTVQSSPTAAAGPTKTARVRTPAGSTGSLAPSAMPSDPDLAASPTVSSAPPVVLGDPGIGSRGGAGALAWLLVLLGVLGLGATAALTTVLVRRSRQVGVEDL
jgi:hypothetical protein